jgi:rhamnulokinase
MRTYYLAVDIGASSGRHILGHIEDGKMVLEEVYRFDNGMEDNEGHLCWNLDKLFYEIKRGLIKCREIGKIPASMGIDTWAVDYVLLDEKDRILGRTYAYRDHRTDSMDKEVSKYISEEDLYSRTGIQKQLFNTIYQLYAHKIQSPEILDKAQTFLMIPDYFNFLLTSIKSNEYTNATSTGLVNAETKDWDRDLIDLLGYPQRLFGKLSTPKTVLGRFSPEIVEEVGFDCEVVLPATHDTGSAFLAVPARDENAFYISSGTWSLMGTEMLSPVINEESRLANLTNEGGFDYRFRYLKNIMGLWIIQSIRRELDKKYGFDELSNMAKESAYFTSQIDVNHNSFLSPKSMIDAIKDYCKKSDQAVPQTIGELMQCVYTSLAQSYAETLEQLEKLTDKNCSAINIVGGGSQDNYLNQLTADYTGKTVYAGPTEGTALGNLMVQMIRAGEFADLSEARAAIPKSFEIRKIESNSY